MLFRFRNQTNYFFKQPSKRVVRSTFDVAAAPKLVTLSFSLQHSFVMMRHSASESEVDEPSPGANEEVRSQLFRSSLSRVAFGTLLLGFFWAAYSWIIVFILLTVSMGAIGCTHFSSLESLYHSQCCCSPRPAIIFLYYATVVNVPLGLISVLSSIFAAANAEGISRVLAGVSLLLCLWLAFGECYFLVKCKQLREQAETDNSFGFAGNQVHPESAAVIAISTMGGNVLPVSDAQPYTGGGRDAGAPIVYGYPIHQSSFHITVQPRSAVGFYGDDGDCLEPSGDPPPYVTTHGSFGYLNTQPADAGGARGTESSSQHPV